MNFFSSFMDKIKEKKAEMDERREFLNMVNEESKPFRRAAYMKEMMAQSINEGIAKAKLDAEKRLPVKKKTPQDFGMKQEVNQWAFLDNIGVVKDSKEKIDLTIPKTNLTKFKHKKRNRKRRK